MIPRGGRTQPGPQRRRGFGTAGAAGPFAVLLVAGVLSGCATRVSEVRHHASQARLERILATILPQTKYPELHYWVRVSETTEHPVGLAILSQRHIYVSGRLLDQVDDPLLTALLAHGVAHHRLHHHGQRSVLLTGQRLAFKAGGVFVPGLSHGHHLGGPLTEVPLSAGQERDADDKTITYLTRMGASTPDFLRALEVLVERDFAERVGKVTTRGRGFRNRIERLRHQLAGGDEDGPTESASRQARMPER